jgi:hypothetical protein
MKLLIVYDEQGDITSVNIPNETLSDNLKLVPQSGQFVTEVDTSQVNDLAWNDTSQDDIPDLVKTLVNNFCIQQEKLVPKR